MSRTVIIDGTTLGGGHGRRGIGTSVRGMLQGFFDLERHERPEVLLRWSQPAPPGFTTHRVAWPEWKLYRVPDPWPATVGERLIRRMRPALFHSTQPALVPDSVPTVVTCHDLIPAVYHKEYLEGAGRAAEARVYSRFLKRLKLARIVMTPSQETADDVVRLAGVDPGRVRVIPWAAPLPIPAAGEVPEGDFVLFSGSVEPHKNARLAIAAISRAPAEVRLVMCGPWSDRRLERLKRFAATQDAEHRVIWLGFLPVERLTAIRENALAVLVPSWKEGFGLPVLEAMAASVPVIASDTPALHEAGGDAARYLPLGDAAAWGDAIAEISASRATRRQMAEAGRAQAARFSWQETARRVREVYVEAMG